ncbi:hypothetical protein [Treponema sp. Marseille-Q4132]|uniref:hypothetical protein n=1 Tax=Treponema sp. Marseille-Q4132 TaxID=2766701 RepID=UPI0016530E78|nr:hypothetical protein [Treponema sp. Marseille-Q4132]QNL97867.1 hypothetical protein H9I35_03695 [Treponema sp. Marseille-Q4132]
MIWIKSRLEALPEGIKVLDAGAGQCKNKQFLKYVLYVAQDFCQYEGIAVSEKKMHCSRHQIYVIQEYGVHRVLIL